MRQKLLLSVFLLGAVCALAYARSCQNRNISPTAKVMLDKLNSWDSDELNVAECPQDHPGRVVSGETNGWILAHKEELQKLGVRVRWNCGKKMYEPVNEERTLPPVCGCRQ